jgi:exportin-2 (importin alpha re-exporter)
MIYREVLQPQMKNIFVLLFQRLTSSKTTKFIRELIVFIFFCVIKYGATFMVDLVDSIQNGFATNINNLFCYIPIIIIIKEICRR